MFGRLGASASQSYAEESVSDHGVDATFITFCLCLRLPTRPPVEGIENRNAGRLEIRNVSGDHGKAVFERRACDHEISAVVTNSCAQVARPHTKAREFAAILRHREQQFRKGWRLNSIKPLQMLVLRHVDNHDSDAWPRSA